MPTKSSDSSSPRVPISSVLEPLGRRSRSRSDLSKPPGTRYRVCAFDAVGHMDPAKGGPRRGRSPFQEGCEGRPPGIEPRWAGRVAGLPRLGPQLRDNEDGPGLGDNRYVTGECSDQTSSSACFDRNLGPRPQTKWTSAPSTPLTSDAMLDDPGARGSPLEACSPLSLLPQRLT